MSDDAFARGDVVWHPAPFKPRSNERPFLVLSGPAHPFHGTEYVVVGLTRTARSVAIELDASSWAVGDPGSDSYASPWYVFTIKHGDIVRPKGALTESATTDVAQAVATVIGVSPE